MVSEAHLWHLHPVRFQTHGAGRQGDRDGGSGPDGWVCSQATLALQTQSQTMCREPTRKHQDEGAWGRRGETTVGGRPPPPEEGEQSPTWKAAQKQNKTEPNKIKTLSVSKPSHLFLFSFSFSSSFSAWQANGVGSLLRMEKIIVVSYICTLQTEAVGLQCLC